MSCVSCVLNHLHKIPCHINSVNWIIMTAPAQVNWDWDLRPIETLDSGLTIIDINDPFWSPCDDHNVPVITFSGANVLMPALTLFLIPRTVPLTLRMASEELLYRWLMARSFLSQNSWSSSSESLWWGYWLPSLIWSGDDSSESRWEIQ